MVQSLRNRRRFRAALLLASVCLLSLYYILGATPTIDQLEPSIQCPQSSLANEILVVVRTGATEALKKLPAHFQTTFRCIPNLVIFSDYDEVIGGYPVHDVLADVDESIKSRGTEFELYTRLKQHGRAGLTSDISYGSGPAGAINNPGWKLDKWKFLPMMDRALQFESDAKWFVFLETDTYVVLENLLQYLGRFDETRPYYIGKHMFIDNVNFAHGGSGFALSNPAIKAVTDYSKANMQQLNDYTDKQWAGDMVLGKALRDINILLFWAWPHFQGDSFSTLDHNVSKVDRRPWCYAPITYHHMRKDEIQHMWLFEQNWRSRLPTNATLRHRDVFKELLQPYLIRKQDDWDNLSTGITTSTLNVVAHSSFENCRIACENEAKCLQFSYAPGSCSLADEVRLGAAAKSQCLEYSSAAGKCTGDTFFELSPVQSGWMTARIEKYVQEMDESCDAEEDGNDWVY